MTALVPAPRELAALAHITADVDPDRLTGWLQGHLTAGVPWPALFRLVSLWLLTAGEPEFHQLDEALRTWKIQHPTQGARP